MTEKPTYKEVLTRLSDEDIFAVEAEIKTRDNRIAELVATNKGLFTIVSEYYNNISVLNANSERILAAGIRTLKSLRDGKGRWKRFPFYYTLLILNEIELPAARKEMQYSAQACERLLKRRTKKDRISQRRYILAERILQKC